MKYLVVMILSVLCGCSLDHHSSDRDPLLETKKVASYGQTNNPYAESKPLLFDNKLVYFDGKHIRMAPLGSLINYDVLQEHSFRNKPEYFSETQAFAVTESSELFLVDISDNTLSFVMNLKGPVLYSPTLINDNKILVQYLDNTVECIDRETLSTLWQRSLPDITSNYYAGYFKPIYDDSRIYLSVPGGIFVAMNIETGEVVWTYTSQMATRGSSHNAASFLSPKSLMFHGQENIMLLNTDGYLHCISIATGLAKWVRSCSQSVDLKERDGKYFAVNNDNSFIAFDERYDDPLWMVNLNNESLVDYAFVEDNIWLIFGDKIWVVDEKGDLINKYQHDIRGPHLIFNHLQDSLLIGDSNKYAYNLANLS